MVLLSTMADFGAKSIPWIWVWWWLLTVALWWWVNSWRWLWTPESLIDPSLRVATDFTDLAYYWTPSWFLNSLEFVSLWWIWVLETMLLSMKSGISLFSSATCVVTTIFVVVVTTSFLVSSKAAVAPNSKYPPIAFYFFSSTWVETRLSLRLY